MKREREDDNGYNGGDEKRQKIEKPPADIASLINFPKELALEILLQLVEQEWGNAEDISHIVERILAITDSNQQFLNVLLDFKNFQEIDFQGINEVEIEQFEINYNHNKRFLIAMIHRLGQLMLNLTEDGIFSFYFVYRLISEVFDFYGFTLVDLYEGSQEILFDDWADLFGFAGVDDIGIHGSTLLMFAIDFDDIQLATFLVSVGADVNLVDDNNQIPLMVAIGDGSFTIVKMLIDSGADVNFEDENGFSVLMFAIQQNNEKLVRLLLDRGAYLFYADEDGDTALSVAVHHGFVNIVQLLLERGADVNDVSENGQTALMIAVGNNNLPMAQLLIEHEIDIDVANNNGDTALMYALLVDEPVEFVSLLLDNGADSNVQDEVNDSVLMIASQQGNYEVVALLLQNGADVTTQNDDGQTALFMSYDDTIAQLLINFGADVNIKDNSDITPIEHFVAIKKDIEIVKVLLATNKLNLQDVRNAREFEMTAEMAKLLDEYIAQQEQMNVE